VHGLDSDWGHPQRMENDNPVSSSLVDSVESRRFLTGTGSVIDLVLSLDHSVQRYSSWLRIILTTRTRTGQVLFTQSSFDMLKKDEDGQDLAPAVASWIERTHPALSPDEASAVKKRAGDNFDYRQGPTTPLAYQRTELEIACWLEGIGASRLSATTLDLLSLVALLPGDLGTPEIKCCWSLLSASPGARYRARLTWDQIWYLVVLLHIE
jgi:hypothetical protein